MSSDHQTNEESIRPHMRRILREIWDPIGLGADGPDDEYDTYVNRLLPLVTGTRFYRDDIAAWLDAIVIGEMCLTPNLERTRRAVQALLALRGALHQMPDTLVRQLVSSDGLQCFWLLRRPDGLFRYQFGDFREETDENGQYSWWSISRKAPSGLFVTATEAEADAQKAMEWMRQC